MATQYRDREEEFDLGSGHSFRWFRDLDGVFGLIEHHPVPARHALHGASYCGEFMVWREPIIDADLTVAYQLIAGGEGEEDRLTVSPALQCRACASYGHIRDGKWVA